MPAAEKGYAENGMGSQAMAQAQGNAETDKQLDQLKHIVSRTLEAKGVLGTIRAQLRAAVFTALDEQERASGVYLENNRVQKIKESDEGRLLAGLLHECFEFYELDRTLSVFMPETTWALEDYSGRQQLSAKLGLEPDAPSPLLLQILRDRLTMGSRSATKPERKSVASSISSCTTSPLSKSESRGVERSPVSANTSEIGSPPSARSSRQSSVASRSPRSGNTDSRSSERKPLSSSSTATSPSAADARLPSTRLKSSSGFSDGALDTKPVIMANVAAPMLSGTMEQEIAQSKAQFDPEFYMSSPSSREAELRARKDEMFSLADRSSIAQEEEESKLTIKDTWSGSMSSPSVVEDIAESDNQSNSYRSQSPSFEEHAQLQEPLSGKSHASNFSKSTSHSEDESENFHQGLSIVGEQDDDDAEAIRGLASQSKSQLKASPISSSPYSFGSDMGEFGVQLDLKSNTQPIAEYDNDNEEDSENEDSDMGSHSDQAIEESASHQRESPNIGDNMQLQEPLSSKSRSSKLSKSASNGSHLEDEEESYGRDMAEDGDSNEFEEEEVESLASQSQSSHKASPMSSSPYSFESDTEGFGVQLGSKPPVPAISGSGDGKDEVESSHGDENIEDSISHRSGSPVIGDKMQSQEPLSGKSGSSKLSKSTFSVNHSEDEEEELELENLASQSKSHSKATPMSSSPYSFESDVEGFGVQLGSKPLTQATTEDDNNDEKDGSEDEDQSVSRHDAEDNEESASHHSESLSFEDHVRIQEPLSGKSRSSKLSKSASNVSHSEDEEESCDHDMAEDGGNDGDEVESLASQSQSIHEASPMNSSRFSFESDMEGFGVQLGSKPPVSAIAASGDGKDEDEISHEDENTEESVNYHRESPVMGDNMQLQEPLSGKSHSSDHSKIASPLNLSEHEEEIDDNGRMKEEEQYDAHNDEEEEDVESLLSQRKLIQKASPMSSSPYSFESDMEGFGVQLGSKPLTQATTEDDNNDGKDDSEDEDQSVSRHDAEDNEESTSHHSELPSFEDHVEIQEPLSGKSRSSKLSKSASNVSHSEDEEESYEEDHELKEDGDNDDSEEEEVESLASQSQPIQKASPMSSSPYSFESDMEGFGVQLGSKPLTQATTEEDSNNEKDDSEDEDNGEFASHHSEAPSFEDHLEIQEPLSGKSHSSKIYKSTSIGIHSEDEEESYDYDMTEDGGNDEVESSHVDEDAEDSVSHRSESSDIADNIQLQEPLSGKSHSSKLSNESHSEDEEENYGRELTEDVSNEEDEEVEKVATSNHESSRLSSSPYSFESDTEGFGVQLGSKPLAQANTKDDSDSDSEGEDGDFDVKNHTAKDLRESNSRHSESPAIGDNMQLQEPLSAKSHSSKLSKSASRASHLEDEEEDYNHDMAEDSDNVNNENGEVESISSQSRSILKASPTSSSPNSLESGMEGFGVQFGSKPLPQFIAKDSSDSEGDDEDGDFSANNRTSEDASEFHSHGSKSPATGNNTQVQEPLSGKSRSSEVSKSISNAGHSDEEDDEESYNHELANEEEQDDDNDDIEEEAERFAFQSKSIHKGSPMSSSPSSFGSDMEVEGFGVHFGSKSPVQAIAKDEDGMEDENRSETESVGPHSREAAGREEAAQKPSLGYDYQNNSFLTQDIISKATEGTPTIDSVQHSLHEDSDGGEFSVSPKEDHERQSNFSQFSDEDQAGVGPLRTSSRDQYSHSTNHEGSIDSHNVEEAEHTNDESEDEEDFSFAPSSGVHKHFHMDNTVGGSHPYSEKVNASKSEEGNQSDVHESVTRDQKKGYGKAHERLASSGRVGLLSSETNEGSFRGSVHSYLQEEEHEEDAGSLSESSHSDKGKVVEYGKAPHAAIADRNSLVEASSTQEEPYSSMGSFNASFDSDEEFGVNIANVIGNKDDVSLSDYSNKVGVNEAEDRKSLETRNDHSNFSKNSMLDEDSDEDKGEGDESDDEYGEDFEDDFEEEEDEEGAEGSVLHNEEISVPSEVESVASLESGSCELSNDGGSKISTEDAKDAEDRSEDTPVAHIKIDLDEQIVESIEFGVSETALQDQCDDIF